MKVTTEPVRVLYCIRDDVEQRYMVRVLCHEKTWIFPSHMPVPEHEWVRLHLEQTLPDGWGREEGRIESRIITFTELHWWDVVVHRGKVVATGERGNPNVYGDGDGSTWVWGEDGETLTVVTQSLSQVGAQVEALRIWKVYKEGAATRTVR